MAPVSPVPYSIRLPLFWGSAQPQAAVAGQAQRLALVGTGYEAPESITPTLLTCAEDAAALFGRGSVIHRMAIRAFEQYSMAEVWAIALAVEAGGTRATWASDIACTSSGAGTLRIWVNGDYVDVAIAAGLNQAGVAAAIAAEFPATSDLCVTGTVVASNVAWTFRDRGTAGNSTRISVDPTVPLPSGLTISIADDDTGATDPDPADAVDVMADVVYSKIAVWSEAAALEDFGAEMDSRWVYDRQQMGHAFFAAHGASADLVSGQVAAPTPYAHVSHVALEEISFEDYGYTPDYEVAAAIAAAAMESSESAPGLKIGTIVLTGCKSADAGHRYSLTERNLLLRYGYTTLSDAGGDMAVDRCVTARWANTQGGRDETQYHWYKWDALEYALLTLRSIIEQTYGRVRLVDDGPGPVPLNCCTPDMVKGTIIGWYEGLCRDGIAQGAQEFAEAVTVVRPENDTERLDAVIPFQAANNLEIFAPLMWFR
jgi:phage tail sheath gpL-like